MKKAQMGLIGLAVMGQNLVLNFNDKGYRICVFNRTYDKTKEFLLGPAKDRSDILGAETLDEFLNLLEGRKVIFLMVKAGDVVDDYIQQLIPRLKKGDIIIDGGNSYFKDTNRRTAMLKEKGILFLGVGVSGGEDGARHGPSMMPGGNPEAWPIVAPILRAAAAKTADGSICADWVGPDGAGHYVKMVHNGIEYADMQLISEAYWVLKETGGFDNPALMKIFSSWKNGELDSYLIEITEQILEKKESDGTWLLDNILDTAGQKGTGKWTAMEALDLGQPVSLIAEAVFARCLSAMKSQRETAAKILPGPGFEHQLHGSDFTEDVRLALLAGKIISYAQGFLLLQNASKEYQWKLDLGGIALLWREGCIIRSSFLDRIKDAYRDSVFTASLLEAPFFLGLMKKAEGALRRTVSRAVLSGTPVPALSAALAFYDGYRSSVLPANLIQAMRDFFGAHTYERTDKKRGEFFHTDWTGHGGKASAGTYQV